MNKRSEFDWDGLQDLHRMDLEDICTEIEVRSHKSQKKVWWLSILLLQKNRQKCAEILMIMRGYVTLRKS